MTAARTYRIWAQGATDQVGHRPYLAKLLPYIQASTEAGFETTFHTITPSVTSTHPLSEFRFAREVIRGAIAAERAGCDAFYMNHFQDVGLSEARSAVSIPVLGLGESTMLYSCTLGRKMGLIAINPAFIPVHEEQVMRYGLTTRVAGLRSLDFRISDYMEAFESEAKKAVIRAAFEREARVLLAAGADVIVPTGGIPMMLFGGDGAHIDGAPIVNGCSVVIKMTEMAVKLKASTGLAATLRAESGYGKPSAQVLDEFLNHG